MMYSVALLCLLSPLVFAEDALQRLQEISLKLNTAMLHLDGSHKTSTLPEVGLSLEELVRYYNYPVETHEVITDDGYILALHRIPHGRGAAKLEGRPAVLLMPGLMCDAGWFVTNGEGGSLGFWLADRGYDVWMANYRGTTHSRRHVTLDPDVDKAQYWDYSFNEIGYYDVPAFIDHVLNVTGQEKLFYIGHSQGTSSFFAMASQRHEYNAKVRLMVAMAPIAYMSNTTNALLKARAWFKDIRYFLSALGGNYERNPHSDIITKIGSELCSDGAPTQQLCVEIIDIMGGGINEKEFNKTMLPVLLSHIPAGSSIKQGLHYSQEVLSGHFRKFDYGILGNFLKYGQINPPDYDLASITSPVSLFYSKADAYANIKDVDMLADQLPNLVHKYLVKDEEFAHLNFGWAIHSEELVYNELLEVMGGF